MTYRRRDPLRWGRTALLALAAATIALPAAGKTLHWEFAASSGGRLHLDLDSGGSVEISGGDLSQVRVEGEVSGREADDVQVEAVETSSGVRVTTRYRERRGSQSSDVRLRIAVPSRYDVQIDSSGGSLTIVGLEGDIRGETMGGDFDLREIRGAVNLSTMGGNISLRDADVDGKLSTMGGNVTFEDVTGDVDGSSMGGRVTMRNVTRRSGDASGDEVVISTMGGEINVDDAPAGAEVRTMGGDIHVRSASEFVIARTMGGDLTIDQVDGWVKGTTMAGDVDVVMVGRGGRRDVELTSYSGHIFLTVPDGLDMTIDIELAYTKNSSRDFRIDSDFPLQQRESSDWEYGDGTPRKVLYATGKTGTGENRIVIRTVNGDVRLRKGR